MLGSTDESCCSSSLSLKSNLTRIETVPVSLSVSHHNNNNISDNNNNNNNISDINNDNHHSLPHPEEAKLSSRKQHYQREHQRLLIMHDTDRLDDKDVDPDDGLARLHDEAIPSLDTIRIDSTETNSPTSLAVNYTTSFATTKDLFCKAMECIHPSRFFRTIVRVYAERRFVLLWCLHSAATLIIATHFAIQKHAQKTDAIHISAPFRTANIWVPTIEFGLMHAGLFQLALIALTMARYTIANISSCNTILRQFVPLHHAPAMHIYLGYWVVTAVTIATIVFVLFFGTLCAHGDDSSCKKLTTEIMCTGYGIIASLLLIGGTSYLRHVIPYQVFYVVHHLVFPMYAITIAHTFDILQRNGTTHRSQTFKWFSAAVTYYVCDRAAMFLQHKYTTTIKGISAITTTTAAANDSYSRMLLVKVRRPALFTFQPGQYAFLRVPAIDKYDWHPFSIASNPSSGHLEFYMKVFGETTWTGKLWTLFNTQQERDAPPPLEIQIMGPYGTPFVHPSHSYSHMLAIGTGTGIVPLMSLYQQHVRHLLRLDPTAHFATLQDVRRKRHQRERASEARKGSLAQLLYRACVKRQQPQQKSASSHYLRKEFIRKSLSNQGEPSDTSLKHVRRTTRQLNDAAFDSARSMYTVVFMLFLPVLGAFAMGFTISWNFLPMSLYHGMVEFLFVLTILLQTSFGLIATFVWDGNSLWALVDVAFCAVAPAADVYWLRQSADNGRLHANEVILFCLHTGYLTLRLWAMVTKPNNNNYGADVGRHVPLERFDLVWVTRSASLVSEILPDIQAIWDRLVDAWGYDYAREACRISIYCTSREESAVDALRSELGEGSLWSAGAIHLVRPDLDQVLQDYTIDLIEEEQTSSQSMLAFCGSPALANTLHHCKISTDLVKAITGHKRHQMEFHAESYGEAKTRSTPTEPSPRLGGAKWISRRKHTSFSATKGGELGLMSCSEEA